MRAYSRLAPDERRGQLIALGTSLFSEGSYDDFSMDDVAEKAGVSKGLLYHYFPTKREFYMASLRAATSEMLELTAPSSSVPPAERLRHGLDAYLSYVREHAAAYRAVLRGGLGTDPEVVAIADEFRDITCERVMAGTGIETTNRRLEMAVRGWIGFVEAVSLEWIEKHEPSASELADLLAETFADVLARWRRGDLA